MLDTPDNRDGKDRPDLESAQFKVGGMSCSFCTQAIERGLGREKGVEEVHVSLAHEEALVRYRSDETDAATLAGTLRSLGYIVRDPRKVGAFDEQFELRRKERNDLISAGTFAVLFVLAMAGMALDLWPMRPWFAWVAWGVATYVFAWNARRIVRMAWGAARRRITNQHVLLSAGALGAYAGGLLGMPLPFSGWQGFAGFPPVDFFAVVVFLTTYHLLSGYVSLLVQTKASESVRRLLEMQPDTARVVRDGAETEVPIEEVKTGDLVRIRPGERIPVDGTVEEGASAVDQSLVTGEPIPEDKGEGDEVIGGSVNRSGTLLVRVTRTGEESFLRQIARHVEEAKAMKPGIIVLVDRILVFYVPAVLTIAVAALLFWGLAPPAWGGDMRWVTGIFAAVTVLVMGYPCALGMATPLALIRGGGIAAERGILMRSGEAFQVLKDLTHVVLDKTGTITEGAPTVVATVRVDGVREDELLRLAAGAELASEHPLARAVVEAARTRGIDIPDASDFRAVTGHGVEAGVDGHTVLVGSPRFFRECGIALDALQDALQAHEDRGHTAVAVAADGAVAGFLAIADTIKADAREAIATLAARGITPVMLTGDNSRTARAVAEEVGIDQVRAEVLPDDKASEIRKLQDTGARVAMVGDGINDAPALTQAHVGIAIGAGTDIAIESSDVVLIGGRLGAVPEAIEIGGLSYRKTVQNLWLAFFFNGVGVPAATTGLLHPSWAMAAMAASVSLVLANSFGGRILGKGVSIGPAGDGPTATTSEETADKDRLRLSVPNIHCEGCVETIRASVGALDGVSGVSGDPKTKEVEVSFRRGTVSEARVREAVRECGFEVH